MSKTTIATIITNGIIFDLKNWTSNLMNTNELLKFVDDLFNTLEQRRINYLLVGGVALLSYIDGRNTQDIDLILSPEDLKLLSELKITDENKDFIRGYFNQLQIDLLLTHNQLFQTILWEFATEKKFGDRVIRCVTVEGLVILKLYALPSLYRQGKFDKVSIYENDILLLLLNYPLETEPIINLLSNHLLKSDLAEVREILADIQSRIRRFSLQQNRLDKGF